MKNGGHLRMGVKIRNLNVRYEGLSKPTLKGINMDIEDGELVIIIGPSGSGKTTLTRCINGLIPSRYPAEVKGSVEVDGINPMEKPLHEVSIKVGTVLQDPESQFVGLTVEEDIAFGLENLCFPRDEIVRVVDDVLRVMGIEHLKGRPPQRLSSGEKKKVAIAGILAMKPDVIIFDEPLANLDPKSVLEMLEIIGKLNSEGKTVIVVEHRFEDVYNNLDFDKIFLIKDGKVILESNKKDILREYYSTILSSGIRLPLYVETVYKLYKRGVLDLVEMPSTLDECVHLLKPIGLEYKSFEGTSRREHGRFGNKEAIRVENVSFEYENGLRALKDVNIRIYEGESVSILGHNGAGKTTLAMLILGILKPTEGRVLVYGKDTREMTVAENARNVGLLMQNPNHMLFQKTVIDEVKFGPINLGYPEERIEELVENSLEVCDLKEFKMWSPLALSLGQKKRVALASILSMDSKMIVLDEPTTGQDWRHTLSFMKYLEKLIGKGYTLLMITHDVNLALEYTDRSIVLSNGRVIADGPTTEVLADEDVLEEARLNLSSLAILSRKLGLSKRVLTVDQLLKVINT
ncbi:MAG: ABC transporter ATP-binding protein [Candidatus Asgardarchaeia archaeon]